MNSDAVVQIVRDALMMAFWLSAPVLLVGLVAGIVMSLLQIVTSIQDSAFSTVPRLAAVLAVLILAMPWMLQKASTYAISILGNLSRYAQ
ncbi:MAG: flagellar biosynthetic protein FliQ [Candidatus Solibacter sp.]